jgi:hypothetical protein
MLNSKPADGQGFLHTSGTTIRDGNNQELILRGMGLGGWMLQEGYMLQSGSVANTQHEFRQKLEELIGKEETANFYSKWLENHVSRRDIDSLAAWGFNSVRLPMHYNLYTLPIEEEPVLGENTWLETGFDLTDSLLSWCEANKMWLILDLHAAPGGQGKDAAISDYDPEKPSLWESEHNRSKMVALWQKLAGRYKNEPWIGGYDLLNETNWEMNNNEALRSLYEEVVDSIRSEDQNHIIFIEGNWFANDFTNLTPPWDDNMVYSFHKYWTHNDQGSIQWVLDIREKYQVPLWLGESGENSNSWFTECVSLMEKNDIGWAWWPMKKVESISCPLSVKKSPGYQKILDYWNGIVPEPSYAESLQGLMELAENLKLENCQYHKDVVDALFRQVGEQTAIPYTTHKIPGVIYTTDFDLGPHLVAYKDHSVIDYHLSTGSYTAWNQGWNYRNDGVDIEISEDTVFSKGFNLGFIEKDEWVNYTVDVDSTAAYQITVRTASANPDGIFRILMDGVVVTPAWNVNNSGGWQRWESLVSDDLILEKGRHILQLYFDEGGFNAGGMNFELTGTSQELSFDFLYGETNQEGDFITVTLNKAIKSAASDLRGEFELRTNGVIQDIDRIELSASSNRIIHIFLKETVELQSTVTLSYTGQSITAMDLTSLENFRNKVVANKVVKIHPVPGRIEAEEYASVQGLGIETTTDIGGGYNIGWTDKGDFLEYEIDVLTSGQYYVIYRAAAQDQSGSVSLHLMNSTDTVRLHTMTLPVTQGWQIWKSTVPRPLELSVGRYRLRMVVEREGFNLNWIDIVGATNAYKAVLDHPEVQLYPNPANHVLHVSSTSEMAYAELIAMDGVLIKKINIHAAEHVMDISDAKPGVYVLHLQFTSGKHYYGRFIKN